MTVTSVTHLSLTTTNFASMKLDRGLIMFGFLSFFLALAPFYPEPHLFGKVRWVLGGAVGMSPGDYFDLFLHGIPFLAFLFIAGLKIGRNLIGS